MPPPSQPQEIEAKDIHKCKSESPKRQSSVRKSTKEWLQEMNQLKIE